MTHHLAQDSAAIFSPSVARKAASNARDWSYVETWLASKLPGRPVPSFERNPETLQALLALASMNEAADEDRQLITRAEYDALSELDHPARGDGAGSVRDSLLTAIEDELPREGHVALEAMAGMAVEAGIAFPEPEDLGLWISRTQTGIHETEQMGGRVEAIQGFIERDIERMSAFLRRLEREDYRPPPELARETLELQRKIKAMSASLPGLHDRAATLASSISLPRLTINDVAREEQEYLALLSQKKQLDAQVAAFGGLSSDLDIAHAEVDDLRSQLRDATSQRDTAFEGLVERESPVRRRH